jgi:hypothetical protein
LEGTSCAPIRSRAAQQRPVREASGRDRPHQAPG